MQNKTFVNDNDYSNFSLSGIRNYRATLLTETTPQAIERLNKRILELQKNLSIERNAESLAKIQSDIANTQSQIAYIKANGTIYEIQLKKKQAEAELEKAKNLQAQADTMEARQRVAEAEAKVVQAESDKASAKAQAEIDQENVRKMKLENDNAEKKASESANNKKMMTYGAILVAGIVAYYIFKNK